MHGRVHAVNTREVVLIDRRATPALVRKLHPVEVEPLFGFPDDWTAHCAATGGAVAVSDGKRLAALGKSIMVPMAAHVLRQLPA